MKNTDSYSPLLNNQRSWLKERQAFNPALGHPKAIQRLMRLRVLAQHQLKKLWIPSLQTEANPQFLLPPSRRQQLNIDFSHIIIQPKHRHKKHYRFAMEIDLDNTLESIFLNK